MLILLRKDVDVLVWNYLREIVDRRWLAKNEGEPTKEIRRHPPLRKSKSICRGEKEQ
jgi:hypothetical protein